MGIDGARGEVRCGRSDCHSCSHEQRDESVKRSVLMCFLNTHVLAPARKQWLRAQHGASCSSEAPPLCDAPVVVVSAREDGGATRTGDSEVGRAIPDVASQTRKMQLLLLDEQPRLEQVRQSAWNGCSCENRAQVWRLLLRVEPLAYKQRSGALAAKRHEYRQLVRRLCESEHCADFRQFGRFDSGESQCVLREAAHRCERRRDEARVREEAARRELHERVRWWHLGCSTLRQINVDLPRTQPRVAVLHAAAMRGVMRRVLFVYSMVHARRGYVQGMNEILTPIVVVFVNDALRGAHARGGGVEQFVRRATVAAEELAQRTLDAAEADAFWAFCELVASVEDNFSAEHGAMLRRVWRLQHIVREVQPALWRHLQHIGVEFTQFAYRWMNCLLIRELTLPLLIRLWDALLGEEEGFSELHVFVCAAVLAHFGERLLTMQFEQAILFLQHLPTSEWTARDMDNMLSRAYYWRDTLRAESSRMKLTAFKRMC